MRRLACALTAPLLAAGCGAGDTRTADAAARDPAPGDAAPASKTPLVPADLAGRWQVRAMTVRGDSLTSYVLTATGDTAGWTITFPNRPPLPIRVIAVKGDSVVTEAGPYPSVLRATVAVRSLIGVHRLQGDRLVGTFRAQYETAAADSVLFGIDEGRRIR